MSLSIMEIQNLHKTFGNKKNKTTVLNNVSFNVEQGTIHGLLGNNGAGKTTLIKCIVGLLEPDSGDIYYENVDILKDIDIRTDNISVLLDGGRNLYLYMTVKENIKYFTMLHGITNYQNTDRFKMIVEYLDIYNILNTKVSNLSFGMRQRASLAVALACDFKLIILDEPTTGLDIHYQEELTKLLFKLRKDFNITIIVSSHDMNFISHICDYCTLLDSGNVVKSGSVSEFINIFGNSHYILFYDGELNSENILAIKRDLKHVNINETNKVIEVLWPNEESLTYMMNYLHNQNIFIKEIKKENNLKSSIINLLNNNENMGGVK